MSSGTVYVLLAPNTASPVHTTSTLDECNKCYISFALQVVRTVSKLKAELKPLPWAKLKLTDEEEHNVLDLEAASFFVVGPENAVCSLKVQLSANKCHTSTDQTLKI